MPSPLIMLGVAGAMSLVLWAASADGAPLPALAELELEELRDRCGNDLRALGVYREGLRATIAFVRAREDLFPAVRPDKARLLPREDRERVLATWRSLLDYDMALDSLRRYHADFARLKDKELRGRAFLACYGAFLAQYRHALEFIDRAEHDPGLDTVLNEPVPELGLPEGTYARYKFRFLNVVIATQFAALNVVDHFYGGPGEEGARQAVGQDCAAIWRMGKGRGEALTLKNGLHIVRAAGFDAWFPVQAGVSEWMGATKVRRQGATLVNADQLRALRRALRPGDVCLARREWHLSNIGLPGFWPHAMLYVGAAEERRRHLAGADVREWVGSQGRQDGDLEALLRERCPEAYGRSLEPQEGGRAPRVIEAVAEGVSFTTLEHALGADCVAVLRPRLHDCEKAAAILRAFRYSGRPYDFNFDFLTDSALVCSELVYKCYEPSAGMKGLRLPLEEVCGHVVTPPNAFVRQFDEQFGAEAQQFDLVAFLDGNEAAGKAVESTLEEFRASWRRPKWHIFIQPHLGEEGAGVEQ